MIKIPKTVKKEEIRRIIDKDNARIYFIGIGGISMSSLALLLKNKGVLVAGSDIRKSEITDALIERGIKVRLSHSKESVISFRPDLTVYSLAIDENNPEYKACCDMNIPSVSRAELLGALMEDYGFKIGVSGSHGKTTVTSMISSLLLEAEREPTVLCGAEISEGSGLIIGKSDYLVYEGCEYGDSFLELSPDVQLLLNLELDHTDYFKSEDDIRSSFLKSANSAKKCCILNLDSKNLSLIKNEIESELHTFSENDGAEYKYDVKHINAGSYTFKLYRGSKSIGEYFPLVKGKFNLRNAVAAAICADVIGIDFKTAASALSKFSGVKRRLELILSNVGFDVFYDYAHHPSEIASVREALCDMGYRKIGVIFAPHTYSRTQAFAQNFANELGKFDTVWITDIYGAREKAVVGVSSSSLAQAVCAAGGKAYAVSDREADEVIEKIKKSAPECVVLMGAGNLDKYKNEFLKH